MLLEAMRLKLRDLEGMSTIEKEHNLYFLSPTFMVPKKKSGTYRMVVNIREVIKRMKVSAGSLPNLEQRTTRILPGSRYFATLDAL